MNESDNDEDWAAAEKALEAACRLPGGKDRIEALKHAGRLRSYAVKKRLAKEAKQKIAESEYHRLVPRNARPGGPASPFRAKLGSGAAIQHLVDRQGLRLAGPSPRSIRMRTELTIARRTNAVSEWASRRL